jgi:hypothetical protein
MKQSGYLFTAGVTVSQVRPVGVRGDQTLQTWDTCSTAIVYGDDAAQAQKTFEDWCQGPPREPDNPEQTEIKKLLGVELIDSLLTESGEQELSWPEIVQRVTELPLTTETEPDAPVTSDLREGYWVDANQVVPPESVHLDVESLKRGLPDDISSDLNWSPDKKFLFIASTLSTPPIPTEPFDDADSEEAVVENGSRPILDEAVTSLPEMREKEAAALVEARNSVVAAWLWRKYVATAALASNEILVSPCCGIVPAN